MSMESSIGIIDGSDGPTAIYLSGGGVFTLVLAAVAIIIIAVVALMIWRRNK